MHEHLYDAETGEDLGVATPAQSAASERAMVYDSGRGHILVDSDGNVIEPSSWDAQQAGVRTVFAQ